MAEVLSILVGLTIVMVTVAFVYPRLKRHPRIFPALVAGNAVLLTWSDGWSLSWLWDWHPWALAVTGIALLMVARAFRPTTRARRKERREERRLARLEAKLEKAEWQVAMWGDNSFVHPENRTWYLDRRDRARRAAIAGGLSKNRVEGAKAHAIGRVLGAEEDRRVALLRDKERAAA